ncbi:MAG TPA: DUF433 domain-containing protein [Puia sp.]|jgi:uncharacterized protein (DUF433 family)|nr:DUF433 domain-containing protein [Puia sp.]
MTQDEINDLLKRIVVKPGVMSGKPIVRGLRFPVADILEMLASGMNETEILEQHPILEKDDIHAALLYASLKINNTVIIHAA